MGVTTYVPTILKVANFLKRYVNSHAPTLKKYMGEGLFTAVQLMTDIVIIIAEIISVSHAAGAPWDSMTKTDTLSSVQINAFEGAWNKFLTSNGITPGGA